MARNKLLKFLLLYPVSMLYGAGVALRNFMFDKGFIFKQHTFDIPIVVIGNLTMGGAGKTPHTEYVIDKLRHDFRIGVLSRGYKRRTHGFVLAGRNSRPDDVGDEPYQMYRKFGKDGVMVAVCENRVKGIEMMRDIDPGINLIVLDDAFQHRYVKPTVSVVLTEHNRPVFQDSLLPFGKLREPAKALDRADIVVVTKCPEDMKPVDFRILTEHFNLFPYQRLLFSNYTYLPLMPLFPEHASERRTPDLESLRPTDSILVVVGVANPRPFLKYIRRFKAKVKVMAYADHHNFTHSDMTAIYQKFKSLKNQSKIMITTEKDAVRMANNPYFPPQMRSCSYYIPINVEFVGPQDASLGAIIKQLVRNQTSITN